jgi:hypothetical protein
MFVVREDSPPYNGQPQLNATQQAARDRLKVLSPAIYEVIRRYESLDRAGKLIFEGKMIDVLEEVEREREAKKRRDMGSQ